MINFVVVEDNKLHRKKLVDLIIAYMMKNKLEFNVQEFSDYNVNLSNLIKDKKYNNVYFLDFELPSVTAIDIAREIREEDWNSPIIILTAYTSLALDAFKQRLQILDFIGKHLEVEKNINEVLNLCIKMLNKEQAYRYTYYNIEYNIPIKNILYIIRRERQAEIKTDTKSYFQNISIQKIKELLPSCFLFGTKGVLINMHRVKEFDWKKLTVKFDNGEERFLISKSHKKEIDNFKN